jgi:ribosomal protein L7Ae-like RNA K-turn-binding protein
LTDRSDAQPAERRLLDLLGLAARAGRVLGGTDAVRKGVRDGGVRMVILAADSSPTQQGKLVPLLTARGVRHERLFSRSRLGAAIGRGPVSAVGIADPNFARRAETLIAAVPAAQD